MSWLNRLLTGKPKSSETAKNRLKMVLTHDRSDISPGMLDQIKDDIIEVIARHLAVDADSVEVTLSQGGSQSRLVAEIPLVASNGRTVARRS